VSNHFSALSWKWDLRGWFARRYLQSYGGPVARLTLGRGLDDTRRRWVIAVALALLVHLPFTPFAWVVRLLGPLLRASNNWDYDDAPLVVPIMLVDDVPKANLLPPKAEAPEEQPMALPPPKPHDGPEARPRVRDGGAPEASVVPRDAAVERIEKPPPREAGVAQRKDAPADSGASAEAASAVAALDPDGGSEGGSGPTVRDTLSLTGIMGETVKKNNVELVFWFTSLRSHPLGHLVSGLLTCNPQWKDFLGDAVDPLQDLTAVMIVGPRLSDTSKVIVAVERRMDDAKTRQVIAALVEKSANAGGFLDAGAGTIAARAFADRADRVIFTHPHHMIWVTPPELYESIHKRGPQSLPNGNGRTLSLTLATPWRPLRAFGAALPNTLSELRLEIVASEDGGADINLEFDDKDAQMAEADAPLLTDQLMRPLSLMLGDNAFASNGNRIFAKAHLSQLTGAIALGFVRSAVCPARPADAGLRVP
jgi:hypothetical protein